MSDRKTRLSVESDAEREETRAMANRPKPRVEKLKAQGAQNAIGSPRTASSLQGEAAILSDERLSDLTNPTRTTVDPSAALQRMAQSPALPSDILALQKTVGNRAVQRLLAERSRQPERGPVGDKYKQEAERLAKQVVKAQPEVRVQRHFDKRQEKKMTEAAKLVGMDETEIDVKIMTRNRRLEEAAEQEANAFYGEINEIMFRILGVRRMRTRGKKIEVGERITKY